MIKNTKTTLSTLTLLICSFLTSVGQTFQMIQKADIPISISNNAVSQGYKNGEPFVFSFAGIDNSKIFSGISLHSYAYDVNADSWTSLPDLPDTLGKIAASASTVKNKIYIIGGYHLLANGNEISSNKAAESTDAKGLATPMPVMSCAEPCMGS